MRWNYACVHAAESADCGPAALATVLLHYGLPSSVRRVAELVGKDIQGTDLERLREGAQRLGFDASAGAAKEGVLDKVPLPAIAHVTGLGVG